MQLQDFVNKLNRPRTYLLLANILLVFLLILLFNLRVLPIKNVSDFIFYTIIYLAFALYRPGWSFLFFVGAIALENINLAPKEIGIMVRPYQFIGGLTLLAVLIKSVANRLGFKLPRWNWYDLLFVIFALAGFLSSVFALERGVSLKQSAVAASFVALYFLARVFIQNIGDLKRIAPFFLSSSLIVALYGLWQNFRFIHGGNPFEFMPGRPNATFTEPDWLGIYLVLLLAAIYALIYFFNQERNVGEPAILNFKFLNLKQFSISKFTILQIFLYFMLTAIYVLLILTVSRSAWLGAFAVTFLFLFAIWTNLKLNPRDWQWRTALQIKIPIIIPLLLSFAIIYLFHLTNFQLFNRAQSAAGLQKITVSCAQNISLPEKIGSVDELAQYGCKHINLEEIQNEEAKGNFVKEIFRTDPNVNIRSLIYQKSWQEIMRHPLLGIGWGNIGKILGTDANGTALNSSNIFLEVWLGSGIIGLTSIVIALLYLFANGIKSFWKNSRDKSLGLFLIIGVLGLTVANLFNAGIMLGFVWLFLALSQITDKET